MRKRSSSSPREEERAELRADVALMRELGVPMWSRPERGEIRLGPPPAPPAREQTHAEQLAAIEKQAEERMNVLFAASSVRPVIDGEGKGHRASVLKSVVPRVTAQEHDHGPQTKQ